MDNQFIQYKEVMINAASIATIRRLDDEIHIVYLNELMEDEVLYYVNDEAAILAYNTMVQYLSPCFKRFLPLK